MRIPPKRTIPGIHMFYTEAQDLDDAVEELWRRYRSRRNKKPRTMTLQREFAQNKMRQLFRPVTVSDRTIPGILTRRRNPTPPKAKPLVWDKDEIIRRYNTGFFKINELAKMGKVPSLQIYVWVYGKDWEPITWTCLKCGKHNSHRAGDDPWCCGCSARWNEDLLE